jgi:hypothetical protein
MVLQQLLDIVTEKKFNFSYCGTMTMIISQRFATAFINMCTKAAYILHVSRNCTFYLYSTVIVFVFTGTV